MCSYKKKIEHDGICIIHARQLQNRYTTTFYICVLLLMCTTTTTTTTKYTTLFLSHVLTPIMFESYKIVDTYQAINKKLFLQQKNLEGIRGTCLVIM